MSIIEFLKKGNKSSGIAALGNTVLTIAKGIAAVISGNGTMLATAMHSAADALNQGFVFLGSAIAEKAPTKRFPTGFGRVVNLFVLIAVIVISIMAYETIIKGWELIQHPKSSGSLGLNVLIMLLAVAVDGFILFKAMKEIIHETRVQATGIQIIRKAFKNVNLASPPTRLVFYEDIIATFGALLALVSIVVAHFTGLYALDGVGTILIGLLLSGIAVKIGYENTIGLIGVAAPKEVEIRVGEMILSDPDVVDIRTIRILQEGRKYHVDSYIELREGLTLAVADDIKFRVRDKLLTDSDIGDVTLGILETNHVQDWNPEQE
ncbi:MULTISPECIES: cation diffusion facilitator family transporter [unclassified Bacillus (in: firmicutes)]|uniref:cation diffusion facilitator family transporter n=1 Tax=unclassified Bacillus (in: firmicutes) TaxID=185979 RepID=UPI0008F0D832|nr:MULTISPECIES: cation diffusion facilitator family transporter [unclassified Bacillus (in: firmicutes)]SFB14156.1 cation diffusion facilitator family transporter [Bacillus sp. UNCCL13]SFQ89793.1 cation diffusion facilitator family transporter [Bacillus sp. cl95]